MRQLIKPLKSGNALKEEINATKAQASDDHLDIWWLGQSGFLIRWGSTCLLFDPYLSDSLTKKYADSDKPHVRMSELVIQPELLTGIDIVTSSHNHTDHLDADTLIPLLAGNPDLMLVIPEANRSFVANRLACDPNFPVGLNDGESKVIKEVTFHGVPAAHNEIDRDEQGRCRFMGFVVQLGKWTLYHSGDTLWYDGMEDILRPHHVDIAFLPINGNDPKRRVAGNLNTREAALLGQAIGAKLVVPHHYNLFEFNTAEPSDFAREADILSQPYQVLQLGERLAYR